jgi:hypothetical protein
MYGGKHGGKIRFANFVNYQLTHPDKKTFLRLAAVSAEDKFEDKFRQARKNPSQALQRLKESNG